MIAARNPVGTFASRVAVSIRERSTAASSTTGLVLGIAITAQKPPAAAAAVPVRDVLLVLLARRAQVHVGVDEAGERCLPSASSVSISGPPTPVSDPGEPSSAMLPVADQDVVRLVEVGAGIEHVGALDQELGGRGGAVEHAVHVVAHHATAARLGVADPTRSS